EHAKAPINPYGKSKLMVESLLKDFDAAYGIKSCSLRYFNAAGGDPDFKIKYQQKKESNLIPLILKSLKNEAGSITIYGTDYDTKDGTCIRDYIHIQDLSLAHILSMEKLMQENQSSCYNLGNGNGFSVKEAIEAAERITKLKVNVKEGARRAGDPPVLIADSKKASQELNWKPIYPSLEKMIEHAWRAMN
ncbi:MAG TPA: GDP-mannose 4,6-dehydratase, partial [Parachlamydiaceae bacterium]|nr:GDP-mannose 4,6-dehydratase [Parachlamydiaceae bacterium]